MGATEIVEKIKDEAVSEREKIISAAKKKADELIKEATAQVELQKKSVIKAEERKGVEELERIVRDARLNARKLRWTAEEEMIAKVLEEAMKRIKEVKTSGFKGNSYSDILAGLIRDATMSIIAGSSTSSSSELEVMLSAEDASFVSPELLKNIAKEVSTEGVNIRLSLSDERIKSAGGVLVRGRDGKIEVNNTFEQRLARFSASLREDIVKTLFKGR
ncbi:MAG: V-type ATP synthase subunit E family protein [Methanophagales archaeon]|nr:V-type ATP synthase subunit E family protein [Methanophagales archaeon]MCW3141907.1 V-type ATP synthase subunit E family protein [Methanophagales archaeon]